MSLLNRVSPTGALIMPLGPRVPLMGNRGKLGPKHYAYEQPCAKSKPWITCVLKDENNVALPKSDIKYTRLFVLDEVIAFAAGHRPCGDCQKIRYKLFVKVWGNINGVDTATMDTHLHAERCGGREGGKKPVVIRKLSSLPNGTMVTLVRDGQPHLLHTGNLFPWSVSGYGQPVTVA